MRGVLCCLALPISMGASGVSIRQARAAEPGAPADDRQARAEARFQQGSAAFDGGRIDEACDAFAESLALYETAGTLLNLALCHEAQGKTASAWSEFAFAAAASSDPAQRERRDFARQHAQKLERSLARLVIDVAPEAGSIAVELDGKPVSDLGHGLPLFVDPGDHVITASAPLHKRFASTLHVPASPATAPLVVRLPALEADADSVSPPATPESRQKPPGMATRRVSAWVVGGAGVAAIGLGAAFGLDALAQMNSCPGACDPSAARTAEAISLVAFGTGVASLATGAWLAWGPVPAPATGATALIRVAPLATARGGGIAVVALW